MLLAVLGLTLMSAQAAMAQAPTPPTPTPPAPGTPAPGTPTPPAATAPPLPANAANVSISLAGARGTVEFEDDNNGDTDAQFDVFVVNVGPGTARNVQVTVSLPEEFRSSRVAGELEECSESNSSEQGAVTCSLGDLPPGDVRQLRIDLEIDDDHVRAGAQDDTTTEVFAVTDSVDPEPSNNDASRELEIDLEEDDD